jgi:predicted nucleotidyltransferase
MSSAHLEALRGKREAIFECLSRHGASSAQVFGSVARGDSRPESDIDLLVELDGRDSRSALLILIALSQELSEIVGRPVDVSTVDVLEPEIRDQAIRDAIPL